MIGLILLSAGSVADVAETQKQLDQIVAVCRAEKVVQLAAHDEHEVEIQVQHPDRVLSGSEHTAFECVLEKLKRRSDLKLGFTGNEAAKP